MPILNVTIVGEVEIKKNQVAKQIADKAAEVLNTPDGHTWVKLEYLSQDNYAESGTSLSRANPVFIELLKRNKLSIEEKEKIAKEFALGIGEILNRSPECIHTYFLPEGLERMAFGGKLMK
jgi:phenylpyruvate tautomerase PptA (4-oxalocrotonate tautomerase family)